MLVRDGIKTESLSEVSFEGSEQAFVIPGLEVEIDNIYAAWEKKSVTLFVRRGTESRMRSHGITSSLRAGRTKEKDLDSEREVTAFRFRWIENGKTLFSEVLEIADDKTFESAYIQWVATTDGHADSVGLAGGHRD